MCVGCLAPDDEATSAIVEDLDGTNGIGLNGIGLNGVGLNGVGLNGVGLNGVGLNGVGLNGTKVTGSSLNGSTLVSSTLVGSTWTGQLSNGGTLQMRIDTATKGSGTMSDVGMYGVSYNTSTGWQRLCGSDASGNAILALAVPGVWNLTTGAYSSSSTLFTWACRGVTIAKCVEDGYKQWTWPTQLQACVRMRRADYCGDGVPHTLNGQVIDFYDNVGVQFDTESTWIPEAEWFPTGAGCITQRGVTRYQSLGLATPSCITSGVLKVKPTCGNSFSSFGAILIDKLP